MSTDDDKYAMDKPRRGTFIIINNENFGISEVRTGTAKDAEFLNQVFKSLGFKVTIFNDLTDEGMLKLMEKVAADEEKIEDACDCFGVAVLSHGGEQGVVLGVNDQDVSIRNLTDAIKQCKKLVNVPKIFIFQACRGSKYDHGVQNDSGNVEGSSPIPMEADCLYAYSTPEGYKAWRNLHEGSWFIQTLCKKLEESAYELDLVKILTRVNRHVVASYEKTLKSGEECKQVPSIVSMLTKDLQFTQKE